eukprot:3533928-Rhodomonas_salina.5
MSPTYPLKQQENSSKLARLGTPKPAPNSLTMSSAKTSPRSSKWAADFGAADLIAQIKRWARGIVQWLLRRCC